ncbi:MAG TPA: FG-GAP-like repeat-containing protein [Opitutaceae bacterium]
MDPSAHPPRRLARRQAGLLLGGALATAGLLFASAAPSPDTDGALAEQELAPRTQPRGRTLFEALSPEETGVRAENRYADPRMWGDLYHEFGEGPIGTGVAIGDYDGDGRPDIFVATKTEGCRLYRNLGGYRFEDVTERAGVGATPGVWNEGVAFVDINNDGRLDIYVCRFNAPNLLYVNQGDGTFKEQAHAYGLDVVDSSVMAAFCDYDRDGRLDLFLQTNLLDHVAHPAGQRNYLFHQNRDGTFTNVTEGAGIAGEAQGHSAIWWDYDNDGWPDLYVANDFAAPDALYHNNRDGTFTNVIDQVVPHMPYSSMGSDLGDLLNDGHIDLLVTDMAATTHEKDQRGMADSRSRTIEDDENPHRAPQYERNALYLNTGTGHCLEAAYLAGLAATDWTWSPRFEDLDNDGRLDLFVTNGAYREASNVDLLARQSAAETPEARHRIMQDSPVLAESHLAFRNLGDLRFENVSVAWGLDQTGVGFGSAFGDLSGDGNLDIVYSSYQGGVAILRNTCDTGHRILVALRGSVSNRYGIGATVRIETASGIQVRPLVLARGYMSTSEPVLHFGLGDATSIRRMTVLWPSGHRQVFENLAVDRRFTVTEPSGPAALPAPEAPAAPLYREVSKAEGLSLASPEAPFDESSVQALMPLRLNRRGPALAVGDVAGDGSEAVVIGGTTARPRTVVVRTAPGSFVPLGRALPAEAEPIDDGPLLLLDAAGTGAADLLVTRGGNALPDGSAEYQPRLLLNDGHGLFRPAPADALPQARQSVGALAAADFDHSGRLGVFIGGRAVYGQYPTAPRSTLLANRGGRFEDVTDSLAPALRTVGMVTAALWSDVDGDGWPDLLLTLDWGEVKYFHNRAGQGFDDWTARADFASAGTGWWTSIASADFNGDGRPDFVVGNVGLNTQYHASPQHPALLYYGDFKGEGEEPQVVEATYEGDRLYPWRTRRDLGSAIPWVLKRFPRNDVYARATLGEILGEQRLAAAQRFAATELRSGVFLSQPDGTYRFVPLPRIAQISPIQGLAAGDFDGDGHADIYAVQNSYAPIPPVGRFDGGLSQLLLGDGRGHFDPIPPARSGLVVPGDAKALVVLDLEGDGRPGFVVSRNNDTTLAFSPVARDGRGSLLVRLHGAPGNPTGVGGRVTVVFADGSTQMAEVFAGSGFYSQSTPGCFFSFAEANRPKTVRVRWPGGPEAGYAVPPRAKTLTLAPPSP